MNGAKTVRPSWGYIVKETLRCFRMQFQVYFPGTVLACAVASCCIYGLQWLSNKLVISHSFESIMEPEHSATIQRFAYAVGRVSIWSIQIWIVWLVVTFALATFAVKMLQDRHSTGSPMKIADAFHLAGNSRRGVLIEISALAGTVTALFSILFVPVLLRPLPLLLMQLDVDYLVALKWARAALILLFAALMTKMALAVPELVDDQNASLGGSIRNSIKATAGWEIFIVLYFGVLGLVGGVLHSSGSDFLKRFWHEHLSFAGYLILLAAFTTILAALAITLFAITYSILYLELRCGNSEAMAEAAESST